MPRPVKYSDRMVQLEAQIIIDHGCTYKEVGKRLHIPKSTVAQHMKYRLKETNPSLHTTVMNQVAIRNKNV